MRKTTKELLQGAIEETNDNIEKVTKARDEAAGRLADLNKALEELEMLAADLKHDLGDAEKETS